MTLIQAADDFRRCVLDFYRSEWAIKGVEEQAKNHRDIVLAAIDAPLEYNASSEPAQCAATRLWGQVSANPVSPLAPLMAAARVIEPHFRWQVNTGYIGVFHDYFFANETYVEIIGPNGLLLSPDCRVGFLILGENLYYPPHHHEATELYHPVSGVGAWAQNGGNEALKPPPTAIFHKEWESHAMRTTEPMLCLWSWTGAGALEKGVEVCTP